MLLISDSCQVIIFYCMIFIRIQGSLSGEDVGLQRPYQNCPMDSPICTAIRSSGSSDTQPPKSMDTVDRKNPPESTEAPTEEKSTPGTNNITNHEENPRNSSIERINANETITTNTGNMTVYENSTSFTNNMTQWAMNMSDLAQNISNWATQSAKNITHLTSSASDRRDTQNAEYSGMKATGTSGFGQGFQKIKSNDSTVQPEKHTQKYIERTRTIKWHAENDERMKKQDLSKNRIRRTLPPKRIRG